MICKESFCSIMNELRDYNDALEKIFDAMGVDAVDWDTNPLMRIIFNIMDALEKDVGDTDDWLGYFAWELDFGRYEMADDCIDVDGKKVSLKSAEDLYDFLVEMKLVSEHV